MFVKEDILPSTNPKSPFYHNLPKIDSKPIDELIKYFKNYKILVKNLLHYFKEIVLVKEFESNLNNQLLNSYVHYLNGSNGSPMSPGNTTNSSPGGSPSEGPNNGPSHNSSSKSLSSVVDKRPGLLKSKSNPNQSFTFKSVPSTRSPMVNTINASIINHHQHLHQLNSRHHKELNKLIPKLENLLKNLSAKIKEIRSSLKNDSFVNESIMKEISKTGSILKDYVSSVETYNTQHILQDSDYTGTDLDDDDIDPYNISKKFDDPFLIKLRLNYQIKNQLIKENYLFAAFINLQNISKDLLTYILKDLYSILDKFDKINPINIKNLNINFDSTVEWENFISTNPNFINIYSTSALNPRREVRHFKNIILPYSGSIHNKCIRFGIIYKKSKVLKNYNRYYYLLTCNFLHEFKIEAHQQLPSPSEKPSDKSEKSKTKLAGFINHNDIPLKSYNLNNYKIVIKNEKNLKFNLIKLTSGKQTSFKCSSISDLTNWFNDLNDLLQFESDNLARFEFVEKKLALRDKEAVTPSTGSNPSHGELGRNVSSSSFESAIDPNSGGSSIQQGKKVSSSKSGSAPSLSLPVTNNQSLGNGQSLQGNGQSLQGIFTPQIRTPSSSGSDKNPFDQSFQATELSKNSSQQSGSQTPTSASTGTPTGQHENYLKLQQEYLKQQQELINLKLKEADKMKKPHATTDSQGQQTVPKRGLLLYGGHSHSNSVESINLGNLDLNLKDLAQYRHTPVQSPRQSPRDSPVQSPNLPVPRTNSNISLMSLESNNHRINNFLQQNENLVPKFFVTDEDEGNNS